MTLSANRKSSASLRAAWVCFSLLAVLAANPILGKASSGTNGEDSAGRIAFGIPLAIADFDGDQLPDLATVTVDRTNVHSTDYSIRFRFSAASESTIGLTARGGGLDLSPRDVNGDKIVDLIVSTVLDSEVVAVLVNDGHGNFSVAEPSAFPALIANARVFFQGPTEARSDLAALASPRCQFWGEAGLSAIVDGQTEAGSVFEGTENVALTGQFCSHLGRSPPKSFLAT